MCVVCVYIVCRLLQRLIFVVRFGVTRRLQISSRDGLGVRHLAFGIALGFGMSSNVDLGLHVCIVCGSDVLLFVDSRIRMSAQLYTYIYIYICTPPHLIRNRDFD